MEGYAVAGLEALVEEPPREQRGRLVQRLERHFRVAAEQSRCLWAFRSVVA